MDDFAKGFLIAMGIVVGIILAPVLIVFGLNFLINLFL
jgi:threonine/homoserine/homoserine lactone efflux protein